MECAQDVFETYTRGLKLLVGEERAWYHEDGIQPLHGGARKAGTVIIESDSGDVLDERTTGLTPVSGSRSKCMLSKGPRTQRRACRETSAVSMSLLRFGTGFNNLVEWTTRESGDDIIITGGKDFGDAHRRRGSDGGFMLASGRRCADDRRRPTTLSRRQSDEAKRSEEERKLNETPLKS